MNSALWRGRCLIFLVLVLAAAEAQTLRLGVTGSSAFGLEPRLSLSELEVEGAKLELRIARASEGPFEFGFGLRSSTSLGPVGNLALSLQTDLDTAGRFEVAAAGNGVIASLAARFRLDVFNVNPGHFEAAAAFEALRPRLPPERLAGRWGAFLSLGASYRLDRSTILELDPGLLYLRGSGVGAHLEGALQLRRLRGRDDGAVLALADLSPGASRGYGAAGFEYRFNPARGPLLLASLWLGAGSVGVLPGARLAVFGRTPLRYRLQGAAEPYRTDIPPYRAWATLETLAGPGRLDFSLLAVAPAFSLSLGVRYDWTF